MKDKISLNFFKINTPVLTLLGLLTLFYYVFRGLNSTIANIIGLIVIAFGLIKLFSINEHVGYLVFGAIAIYFIFVFMRQIV